MNNKSDKRDFDRIPMEIGLEVSAEDNEENQFNEKTVLKDISGGGARFMTQLPGKYFPGQLLAVTIYLPGTSDVKARMRGKATVVRIYPPCDSPFDGKSRETGIAVKLDTTLNFERVDVKTEKDRREPSENF